MYTHTHTQTTSDILVRKQKKKEKLIDGVNCTQQSTFIIRNQLNLWKLNNFRNNNETFSSSISRKQIYFYFWHVIYLVWNNFKWLSHSKARIQINEQLTRLAKLFISFWSSESRKNTIDHQHDEKPQKKKMLEKFLSILISRSDIFRFNFFFSRLLLLISLEWLR